MNTEQPEEDEITWGSDELPIENLNSQSKDGKLFLSTLIRANNGTFLAQFLVIVFALFFTCYTDKPIITQDELTSLPLVRVVPDGQYTGPKLYNVVRMMKGLLEQKVPLQEFEVNLLE